MENSVTSRICTYQHQDSSWTSSMDDLLFFDHTTTTNALLSSSSSSYDDFQTRLCFSAASSHRKRRNKPPAVVDDDDDLEDTATSPPHPSIISKVGKESEEYGEVEDRIEVGFVGRDKNCSTGLNNIGLCLVPVSMAVNYFG